MDSGLVASLEFSSVKDVNVWAHVQCVFLNLSPFLGLRIFLSGQKFKRDRRNGCVLCQVIVSGVSANDSWDDPDVKDLFSITWDSPHSLFLNEQNGCGGGIKLQFFFPTGTVSLQRQDLFACL